MQCHNPYIPMGHSTPAPCRKCIACRVNWKRLWTHRLILERKAHDKSAFVTLTYDDENLERVKHQVSIREIQKFNKRLRKKFSGIRIRFYAVGEYGDRTWRPHYHIAYFGISCEHHGGCTTLKKKRIAEKLKKYGNVQIQRSWYWDSICDTCKKVEEAWDSGFIQVDELNDTTSGYICGYCTKK